MYDIVFFRVTSINRMNVDLFLGCQFVEALSVCVHL
jgi:hypothetical protein